MTERYETQKMAEYEMSLKLDRMTQRSFGDKVQKPPKKPLSVVDVEVIKEYQKQFNEPVREYEMDIDEETGEERVRVDEFGNPIFKVIAKKFRVVPPPELEVVEDLVELPSAQELRIVDLEVQKGVILLQKRQQDLKDMVRLRKELVRSIDDLPSVQTFINEQLPSGRFVMRPNPNAERQREQILQEKERRVAKLEEVDENLDDVKTQIDRLKDGLDEYNIEKARLPELTRQNQAKISKVKQINTERIKNYQETLNLMNRGAFQQDKMPDETEEDYLARLQANAEEEYTDETLFEADLDIKRKFKEALKKLIRDDIKIEQVANSIRDNEIEIKNDIIKRFPLFKKKFLELYGLNNPAVSVGDIRTFIDAFTLSLKGDDALLDFIVPKADERELPEYTLELAEKDRSKVLTMINPANDRKLYWRLAQYFEDDRSENLVALYSFTGKRESYKSYNPREDGRRIKDETGFTSSFIKKYFENKPIPVMLVNRIEPSSEYDIHFPIAKEPTQVEGNYLIGWGIKEEEIPEMVNFGKIKLALNKLFFKNILSVRHANLGRIAGFPNVKVSDDLVAIIMKLSKGEKLIKQEIDALQKSEQMLYDNLLSLANLHKKAPNNKSNTIKELKYRMEIITGLMEAGNDNRLLVKELYQIVHALKSYGVITNAEATKYLSQF